MCEKNINELNSIWKEVLEVLKNEMIPISFEVWYKPLIPVSMNEHTIYLKARSEFQKNVILRDKRILKDALKYVIGDEYEIEIVLEEEDTEK